MLKTAFSGMNIREEKIDRLCARVLEATNPMNEWNAILGELELLAQLPSDVDAFEQVIPILKACNFKESETNRLAASLTPSKWLDLSLFQLDFHPNFSYCTNSRTSVYIDFANASAGQQATALLTVLLNQPGAPLIIDQPEDDIDSKMIDDIVKQVWNTKKRRQLIFASHNANIVVNGDAELVVCFGYASAGDHTNGVIMAQGAIDKAEIKREITEVTEGGEKAFKLRKEKYGF
jgi:type III restriction enzyme